ncbi:hypothetical protein J5N97_020932 [Dioscorea zingiberensis]|uniref:Uncharacterized protein n=1 Tax=Dioscorea zingiberensis TaxID=325984 RepID=A0A9D5CGR7_9LILI|nr:hypothetical protein J5N97_020932 [Dioscorea zingiberensis]
MISQYNLEKPEGIYNLINLITKQIMMKGILVMDYVHLYPKFMEMVIKYIKSGEITYLEDKAEEIENAPAALVGLFRGRYVGKQLVQRKSIKVPGLSIGVLCRSFRWVLSNEISTSSSLNEVPRFHGDWLLSQLSN